MDNYIGFKNLKAKKMDLKEYNELKGRNLTVENKEGYLVKYSDDYESWSPKDVFEKAYMQVSEKNTMTQKNVDEFIKNIKISTIGEKTTMVIATLINGFEIIETSSCVDALKYNEELGAEICIERIKNKVWELLGFLLQTAIKGIK